MLRRRTGQILSALLLLAVCAGLVGAAYVVWVQPGAALAVAVLGFAAACAVCLMLDELGWLLVALSAIFAALGNGLYALYLLGAGYDAIATAAAVLVGLVFLILARALIAAGSADYPYDE